MIELKVFLMVMVITHAGVTEKRYGMESWKQCIEALDSGHFKTGGRADEALAVFCIKE